MPAAEEPAKFFLRENYARAPTAAGSLAGTDLSSPLGFCCCGLSALADVDAALEEGAVFDGDASGDDVAGERTVAANVDAVAGGEVAADFAQDHDLTGIDVGGDNSIASDSDAVAGQIDGTFDAAVDVERLGAGHFALDDERLADGGLVSGGGGYRPGSDGLSGTTWLARWG